MSALMSTLGIDRLSVEQRMQLVRELCDSFEADDAPPLTEGQIQELDRRIAALDRDPSSARPWNEVRARLRARLQP